MEFNEKLQELRKNKGLTQEELAEVLFVSRTAVSKWESGRGYPSIDSLKEIANYFSVTIDELLSGEKIISIAEKENKSNIQRICDLLFGIVDVFSFMLIILPLYSNPINGYIYSVNLFSYTETSAFNLFVYWIMFTALIISGAIKVILTQTRVEKGQKLLTVISMGLSILTVLFLAMTRDAYAITVTFLLLIIKGILLLKHIKASN
ncbi:MAG: helix-turn-helix transcriptional regulator [Sphaerochaetaceae bacterium]|nr:helix-turn-helix transcriptional regulator [Sphaerochaetaceae bacterium]